MMDWMALAMGGRKWASSSMVGQIQRVVNSMGTVINVGRNAIMTT